MLQSTITHPETLLYITLALAILLAYLWNEHKSLFITPRNDRHWRKNQSRMPVAHFNQDGTVTIANVRDTAYNTRDDYITRYTTITVRPSDIVSAHIHTAHLAFPGVHMFTTFVFKDGRNLTVSIKMRTKDDKYGILHALRMFFNPSELIYIIMTEHDALHLNTLLERAMHRYELALSPDELSRIFISALHRANKLAQHPEFYSIFSNNCITNVLNHINEVRPGALPPMHWSYMLTTHLDTLLRKRGVIT